LPRLSQDRPLPEIVRKHYEVKPGFANFFFNRQNGERVWKAFTLRGDFSRLGGVWTLVGDLDPSGRVAIELSDDVAIYRVGLDEALVPLNDDVTRDLQPPRSGGLLAALGLWRRLLVHGPKDFGEMHYLGTAPLYERGLPPQRGPVGVIEADVLIGTQWGAECRFYFAPGEGSLLAMEMFPEEDSDPCEIYFSEYKLQAGGLYVPRRIEVRHGDVLFGVFQLSSAEFAPPEGKR
jgi:hypothetical protein